MLLPWPRARAQPRGGAPSGPACHRPHRTRLPWETQGEDHGGLSCELCSRGWGSQKELMGPAKGSCKDVQGQKDVRQGEGLGRAGGDRDCRVPSRCQGT